MLAPDIQLTSTVRQQYGRTTASGNGGSLYATTCWPRITNPSTQRIPISWAFSEALRERYNSGQWFFSSEGYRSPHFACFERRLRGLYRLPSARCDYYKSTVQFVHGYGPPAPKASRLGPAFALIPTGCRFPCKQTSSTY